FPCTTLFRAETSSVCGGRYGVLPLPEHLVVPRQLRCLLPLRDLHLEDHLPPIAERGLHRHEIELPHAAEPFIVQLCDALAVGFESLPPFADRVRVVDRKST